MALSITHCVCRNTPFVRLRSLAREGGWTLDDLMRETGCGASCGLCRPYLRRMLESGQTDFHEILTEP